MGSTVLPAGHEIKVISNHGRNDLELHAQLMTDQTTLHQIAHTLRFCMQEIEDQMLALLSAALSSLTLLKTHFTFDRYVSQMLQRFNLGASKVISMCGSSQRQVQPHHWRSHCKAHCPYCTNAESSPADALSSGSQIQSVP